MLKKTVVVGAVCALATAGALSAAASPAAHTSVGKWVPSGLAIRVGTQSPAEIDRIMHGGGQIEAYVDPDTGAVLAAQRSSWRSIVRTG
ncbi:hypothetical protein ACO0E1_10090 [Curtobacterium sp. RRHDQ66]|uniref:hypothetical protein n=1 Tax=Curtobacterium guangdongense TaxID=3413380 RepID=UPI003BF3F298